MLGRTLAALTVTAFLSLTCATRAAELLQEGAFIPATMGEAGRSFSTGGATRVQVIADRVEYLPDDLNAQFLVCFLGVAAPDGDPMQKIALTLKGADGRELAAKTVGPLKGPKLPVIVPVSDLKPGKYSLAAALLDKDGKTIRDTATVFTLSDRKEPHAAFPAEGIPILVHPQAHVPDAVWPIRTGVPMPNATLRDVSGLTLLENGRPAPAQFIPRATWGPGGYVKWVGLDFAAKYDNGVPRSYTLVQRKNAPAPGGLKVDETKQEITVDTGVLKFVVGRKFAGIEQAWLDRNKDGQYAPEEMILSGKGGSFVVSNRGIRYDSAFAPDGTVTVEESGPMCAVITAKGAYATASGATLCMYVVRITAYAGQPFLYISHRTVNTIADQYESVRIADCGFEVAPQGAVKQWRFGFDGAEKAGAPPAEAASIFLHQDRDDHLRILQGDQPLGEGRRSDGWCSAQLAQGSVTYVLRDIWQKYPKEFEFDLAAGGVGKMAAHFWPKHGHRAFTDAQELDRNQIYKVRWAHEGQTLEMLIPANYHQALDEINKKEPWAHDGEFIIVNPQGQTKMQAASGQGTVIGDDLYLWFDGAAPAAGQLKATAALVQQGPHALSDPRWNAATAVYGPIAARDPAKFAPAEKLMDTAYTFYRKGIIGGSGEYGMWIYGGVHGDWAPKQNGPALRRVWQQCHYQNIFQAWLLYLRSGDPDAAEWARIHSNQHLDVGVCNFRKYPPRQAQLFPHRRDGRRHLPLQRLHALGRQQQHRRTLD